MSEKKSFGYRMGQVLGGILVVCGVLCLSAIAIALTGKFIFWLI